MPTILLYILFIRCTFFSKYLNPSTEQKEAVKNDSNNVVSANKTDASTQCYVNDFKSAPIDIIKSVPAHEIDPSRNPQPKLF